MTSANTLPTLFGGKISTNRVMQHYTCVCLSVCASLRLLRAHRAFCIHHAQQLVALEIGGPKASKPGNLLRKDLKSRHAKTRDQPQSHTHTCPCGCTVLYIGLYPWLEFNHITCINGTGRRARSRSRWSENFVSPCQDEQRGWLQSRAMKSNSLLTVKQH